MKNTTIETPGLHFKRSEAKLRHTLPRHSIVGLRLDGKAFHTFTRQFERPFDLGFMNTMDDAAQHLLENLAGAMFGYIQSDEISVFFSDLFGTENTDLPFGGKCEKILTTSSSMLTGAFMKSMPEVNGIPVFDARLFELESLEDLHNYVDWRRLDARKNSISMAASTLFSESELKGKSTRDRHAMLEGTPFEVLPGGFFEGRLIVRGETGWQRGVATREDTANTIAGFRRQAAEMSQKEWAWA